MPTVKYAGNTCTLPFEGYIGNLWVEGLRLTTRLSYTQTAIKVTQSGYGDALLPGNHQVAEFTIPDRAYSLASEMQEIHEALTTGGVDAYPELHPALEFILDAGIAL